MNRRLIVLVQRIVVNVRLCVVQLGIPIGAAAFRRAIEKRPERIDIRSAAWILSGIRHLATHLSTPEVADLAVTAGEHIQRRDIAVFRTHIGARVVAAGI